MKYCPLCEKTYANEAEVCEVDRAVLRESGSKQDPLIGKIIKRRYQVLKSLGKGGMGTVYLAEQVAVSRKVALKILHPEYARDEEFVRRFHQEAKLAASLNHRNVVMVFDFDQADDGSLYIVMEYVDGNSLARIIRDGPMEVGKALHLATQIAEGLGAAHRAGVIHRDVKPENIMVVGREEIKLMDFGIARLRDAEASTRLTRAGAIMGTPSYMAPEQIEAAEIGERTDIYAFGVVLYEILSGNVPFKAATPGAVLIKHLREMPVPLRKMRTDIPASVERIVLRALEKRPESRQANMEEIVEALKNTQRDSDQPTMPVIPEIEPIAQQTTAAGPRLGTIGNPLLKPMEVVSSPEEAPKSAKGNGETGEGEEVAGSRAGTNASLAAETVPNASVFTGPAEKVGGGKRFWIAGASVGVVLAGVLVGAAVYRYFHDQPMRNAAVVGGEQERTTLNEGRVTSPLAPADNLEVKERVAPKPPESAGVGREAKDASKERSKDRPAAAIAEKIKEKPAATAKSPKESERAQLKPVERKPAPFETVTAKKPGSESLKEDKEKVEKSKGYSEAVAEFEKAKKPDSAAKEIQDQSAATKTASLKPSEASLPAPIAEVRLLGLSILTDKREIKVKERLVLSVKGKYSNGRENEIPDSIRWESSDTNVAVVNSRGELEGRGEGKAQITAKHAGVTSSAVTVFVKDTGKVVQPEKKEEGIQDMRRRLLR